MKPQLPILMVLLGLLACRSEPSYAAAVQSWTGPDDINRWIAARFVYDSARAKQLSADRTEPAQIKTPADFFADPDGVCVDLARFGVETLRAVAPHTHPKYLMIEFEPVVVAGHTFRRHWLATFTRDGSLYTFADSKRPGHIAGPYESLETLLTDYADFRDRKILEARSLNSYRKQRKKKRLKSIAAAKDPAAE